MSDIRQDLLPSASSAALTDLITGVFGGVSKNAAVSVLKSVLEFANLAAFPATGVINRIYVAQDTNLIYHWNGAAYVALGGAGGSGEVNTSSNSGTGAGWAQAKSGVNLPFKSFITDKNFSIVSNTNDLTLKFGNYVNILDYGAVGDNTTDNSTALANAIASGKNVCVPAGDFKYATGITLNDNQSLFGFGESSHLVYSGTSRAITIGNQSRTIGLKIESSGGAAAGNAFTTGIFCYQKIKWLIEDCTVVGFSGSPVQNGGGGIYGVSYASGNTEGGRINACFVDSNNCGIGFADRGEYNFISNCIITNNTVGYYSPAGNNYVSNCNIQKNVTGVKLTSGVNAGHSSIVNCAINHNTTNNIDIDSQTLGMSFVGCGFFNGNVSLSNNNGVKFVGCDFSGTTTFTLTANTNLYRIACYMGDISTTLSHIVPNLVSGEDFTVLQDIAGFGTHSAANTVFAQLASGDYKIIDTRATKKALEYNADYSSAFTARSLVDKGSSYQRVQQSAVAAAATTSIDLSIGSVVPVTMGASITTLNLNNPSVGQYILKLTQDATGGRTITWPASVKWPAGTAPTLSAANKTDIITLTYDGTNFYGSSQLNF